MMFQVVTCDTSFRVKMEKKVQMESEVHLEKLYGAYNSWLYCYLLCFRDQVDQLALLDLPVVPAYQ